MTKKLILKNEFAMNMLCGSTDGGFLVYLLLHLGMFYCLSSSPCLAVESIGNKETISKVMHISGEEILAKAASVYGNCETYIDSGYSTTIYSNSDGSKKQLRYEFRTAFQKGKKFRFAYRRNAFGRGYDEGRIIWYDGLKAMVNWAEPDEFEAEQSLGSAVAGFTGVSSGTAHNIPALLMPRKIGGHRILDISAVRPVKKETIKGKVHYQIEGQSNGDKSVLWIDADSFLIMRIEENFEVQGKPHLRATFYTPTINGKVPSRLFEKRVKDEWQKLNSNASSKPLTPKNPK